MTTTAIPKSVSDFMQRITDLCGTEHADWAENFNACFADTLTTTVKRHDDGTTFLLTGDIPAMWLRDSTAQLRPYLALAAKDDDIANLIAGLVRQQFRYITIDPYANAFNEEPNGASWDKDDQSDFSSPWLWERKYEVDSLCYPIQLAWMLYANTGNTGHFDAEFIAGVKKILDVFETEQHHERSPYFFIRDTDIPTESLSNNGKGSPVAYTGMTWSGFRPSDDACTYHYLVPSNMFAAVVMGYLERIFGGEILNDPDIAARAGELRRTITEPQWRDDLRIRDRRPGPRQYHGRQQCALLDGGPLLGILRTGRSDISGNPTYAAQRRKPVLLRGRVSQGHRLTAHPAALCVAHRPVYRGDDQ